MNEMDDYYDDNDVDIWDLISDEQREQLRKQQEEYEGGCPISMDSLGMSYRDFM